MRRDRRTSQNPLTLVRVFLRSFETKLNGWNCARILSFLGLVFLSPLANAERLPIRKFTPADGLPSATVTCVKRDSRGFLWFCTTEGFSRFDGNTFTNYGIEQGLPDRVVTDFLETRDGEYWVATLRGVARFDPIPATNKPMFTVYHPSGTQSADRVNTLFQDREGVLWVGSDSVYQFQGSSGHGSFTKLDLRDTKNLMPVSFAQDHEGNLWIGLNGYASAALYWRSPDGRVRRLEHPFLAAGNKIWSLFIDREDRIWIGTFRGLALLTMNGKGKREFNIFSRKDGLPAEIVGSMFQSSDGKLWLGCGGLLEVTVSGPKVKFKLVGRDGFISIDAEDLSGNFWMGSTRWARHGFINYGLADGLKTEDIRSITEGPDGQLYVVTGIHSHYIHRFDGKRFAGVEPFFPGHDASWDWGGWGWGQIHLQDHSGEWWVVTGYGLARYPRVKRLEDLAHTAPLAIYTVRDGLASNDIFRLYEDSRGDIWISAWGAVGLTRWERASRRFYRFEESARWPSSVATAFREDRNGNVWIGLWDRGLVRYRRGPREEFQSFDQIPDGSVLSIWQDHAGRLWVATTRGGLVRIDDPNAGQPQFRTYTKKDGLSSNDVRAITEDQHGRIYFWTGRGVDALQPETGGITHYTTADGLVPAGSDNQEAYCDHHGNLWFGFQGLSRFEPNWAPRAEASHPPLYIRRVRVTGVALPISELGATQLSGLVFQPGQNNLQIEFAGLNFGVGEIPQYQYKLEGSDKDWSTPSDLRTVNYADLSPGSYQFEVRLISGWGKTSPSPASVSFRILAPIWKRWWFLTLATLISGLAAFLLYQYRVNRLLELERIRTRIATNLHDDIGSTLTQIAILSEVANRKLEGSSPGASEPLSRIAEISRDAVDAMSDIVWAVNPRKDTLGDLIQRMRRFASDVLSTRGIEFLLRTSGEQSETVLRGDLRQEIFLIFKEGINNIVRHAHCKRVEVSLSMEEGQLILNTMDDGKGLESGQDGGDGRHGHGLGSMKARAQNLAGTFHISSEPGRGTAISVRVPLDGRRPRGSQIPT